MTSIKSRDDVLTLLAHLGYLAFDAEKSEVYIPNREVEDEFENAVSDGGWNEVAQALRNSDKLVNATLRKDAAAVAEYIDRVHMENTSLLE